MKKVMHNFEELRDVMEPYDPSYVSDKPYEIPQLSASEKAYMRKLSILHNKLRSARLRITSTEYEEYRISKRRVFKGKPSEYLTYMYLWVENGEYCFGTEDKVVFTSRRVSATVNKAIEWLNEE